MRYFFESVLVFYAVINIFLFARLYAVLAGCGAFRTAACAALLAFAVSFPASRVLADRLPEALSGAMALMGSLYIAPMLYGFMFTAAADILRKVNGVVAITHYPPPYPFGARMSCAALILAMSMIVTLAGVWNANSPTVATTEAAIENVPAEDEGYSIRIAALSDIHLGRLTGPGYLRKLVALTNEQSPDIVLLVGDTADGADLFADEGRVAEVAALLSEFNSRLGTWAVMGNHDYYAGIGDVLRLFERAGVRLLRDEAVMLDGKFVLAGRDDLSSIRYGVERKSVAEILSSAAYGGGAKHPVILMNHQPFNLEEASDGGVAFQISGHTHRGQLWPINFLVGGMYEKSYGPYKKGGTHYYISSGAGVWGPPVRTIGRPEIVIVNLRFGWEGGYEKWNTDID
jgi:predicted MPP superfamily phosphohydrolase